VEANDAANKVSFAEFFWIWSEERRWKVPDVHWRAADWLENRGRLAVLRCFRGFGKSTLLAVYNAWRYYDDPTYRILHQGDQDKTAYKTSRDTRAVLMRHPLTREKFEKLRGEASFWWVPGANDERNPSMQAAGITSNITSSRCEEAQNDDVEVPRNIQNPEAREKMRYRLGEQTHCMVPGARQLFVGTPHTHDSLYDEMEALGADCLTIKMFEKEHRSEQGGERVVRLDFVPEMIFAGIGKTTKLLRDGADYRLVGTTVHFAHAPGVLVDFYAESSWPERFTPSEMHDRRKKCRTINEWDSQYQLRSRPLHQIRLDPARIQAYDVEPKFVVQNKKMTMWLGKVQIVGMSLRWDPSSGKTNSDVSAAVLDLQDAAGRHYWHRVEALEGVIAETSPDGKTMVGGQVIQLRDLIEKFKVPRVNIETNGIGGYAPAFMRTALKQKRIRCGIGEEPAVLNKNRRILEALEPLINSGMLWAHISVLEGPLWNQMRDWNPAVKEQPDDLLDAGAGAVTDQPARIGQLVGNPTPLHDDDWRPTTGVFEATLEA
jgi:hypothetical protein